MFRFPTYGASNVASCDIVVVNLRQEHVRSEEGVSARSTLLTSIVVCR